MLKANGAVIYSVGQMEGQTQCHHGYFIKLRMTSLTHIHTVSVPVLLAIPCAPANQPSSTNMRLLPKINTDTSRQDYTDDLADKLEYGGAKKIPVAS